MAETKKNKPKIISLDSIDLTKRDKIFVLSLQDAVERRKLNPEDLFYESDLNKDEGIDWPEFGAMLRKHFDELNFPSSFLHVFKRADLNDVKFLLIFKT